jgi:hypothetical protein
MPIISAVLAVLFLAGCGLPQQAHPAAEPSSPDLTVDGSTCGGLTPAASHDPATQATPPQAESIVRQYWQGSEADGQKPAQLDCTSSGELDEGPQEAMSVADTQIAAQLKRPSHDRPNPIQALNVYVPRLDQYPLWFAATVKKYGRDDNTGKLTSEVVYQLLVFTRMSARARWKLYVGTNVPGGNPKVAKDAAGYAAGRSGPLAEDPAALPQRYVSYMQSVGQQHADMFAPGAVTDGALKDVTPTSHLTHTFQTLDGNLSFTLPMQDGGALTIFTALWKAHLDAGAGGCYIQDASRTKRSVIFAPGSWQKEEIDSIMMRVALIPRGRGKVDLLGDNGLILSKGVKQC